MNETIVRQHKAPQELDVFACALEGVNQIEASAGTGKTWNICALYIRLLLEKNYKVDKILVVTFTKVATAQLHERIRRRLVQLKRAIETTNNGGDPFITRLFETTLSSKSGIDFRTAENRVGCALRMFDQAAIHTIHAFCQRALQEVPFSAALPLVFTMEVDNDAALRFELAVDFWRERVEPIAAAHSSFAAWLVENRVGPASLDTQLMQRLQKPLALLRLDSFANVAAVDEDTQMRFDAARELWESRRDTVIQCLTEARPWLSKTSHKPEAVSAAIMAWCNWFAQGDCHAPLPRTALKLTASALKKATKLKFIPPEHEFFTRADELATAAATADAVHRTRWLELVKGWLRFGPDELSARKRARHVLSFNDLLSNLYYALTRHLWLKQMLRARYSAALIDEFQDTDPLQFAIFNRIFAPRGPLFLVGDPKQAIYSFRSADLHTYLSAHMSSSAHYTLAVNQRSTRPIVEACNRLFKANSRAFVFEKLDYQSVCASDRWQPPFRDDAGHTADFCIWRLPEGLQVDRGELNEDAILTKRAAQYAASEACAQEIVRLLRDARTGRVKIGDTPLTSADIAVLVQTHRQGSLIKRVLAAWGVNSVELAHASVFSTPDAEQIERVLIAIDMPSDLRRLRAALATDWFGFDASALWGLEQLADVSTVSNNHIYATNAIGWWVERFSYYRSLWYERGFAVMWHTMMRELRVAQHIASRVDGERRLTDVKHLAELVQGRSALRLGVASTLRWLATQRIQGGGDEAQLRLESDRNLVQIVTVHKSKGLEYAVVFCPFLNDGVLYATPSLSNLPDAYEYHDSSGHMVLHYGCNNERTHETDRYTQHVQAAERARLIYVALTRAVYRCYLVVGPYLSSRSIKESQCSVLNWLVAGEGREFNAWFTDPPDVRVLSKYWHALAGGPISIEPLPSCAQRIPLEMRFAGHARMMQARINRRTLHDPWQLASFSSLMVETSTNYNNTQNLNAEEKFSEHEKLVDIAADDILVYPRGAAAGKCLHKMFELANFADSRTWPEAIQRALVEYPVTAATFEYTQRLSTMMRNLLKEIVAVELVPSMTLALLNPRRRLSEFEFVFPVNMLAFDALRDLLSKYGYPDIELKTGTLHGFLRGCIDMIVEHNGRYWIVDWKSNYLGNTIKDYSSASLDEAMTTHAYHLQALLYTVALHRYLRTRLPDYTYESHIGGYLYLFIRGMRVAWCSTGSTAGVHMRHPDAALIASLDALIEGKQL